MLFGMRGPLRLLLQAFAGRRAKPHALPAKRYRHRGPDGNRAANGARFEITVGEFPEPYVDQANRIAGDLTAIGLKPVVERVSTRIYGDEAWFGGKYQMLVGAQPPATSITEFLMAVHHSNGLWNTTGFSTPEIDRLIEIQAVTLDPGERRRSVLELQRELFAGAHRFSPATEYLHWVWSPRVNGFVPNAYRGESYFLTLTWLWEP